MWNVSYYLSMSKPHDNKLNWDLIFQISSGKFCFRRVCWSYCSLFSKTPGTGDIVSLIHTKHTLPSNLTSKCFLMFMKLLSVLLPHRSCKTTCVRGLNNWALCPEASMLIYTILPHQTATADRSLYKSLSSCTVCPLWDDILSLSLIFPLCSVSASALEEPISLTL